MSSSAAARSQAPGNAVTREQIIAECVKHGFYRTPSCNDKLYLHHKGFDGIAPGALHDFTDARVIWFEGNCLQRIGDDDFASQWPVLRQLYLHNNMLKTVEWAGKFQRLGGLNLSENYVETLRFAIPGKALQDPFTGVVTASPSKSAAAQAKEQGKDSDDAASAAAASAALTRALTDDEFVALLDAFETQCRELDATIRHERGASEDDSAVGTGLDQTLTMLQLKNNQLKRPEDLVELLALQHLNTLDLSGNKLEDGERVLRVLERLPCLKSLYLSGNPCVRSIPNYRKTVIARCKLLRHLDDRPVFDDERRLVTAWAAGGLDAERKEKQKMKEEEEAQQRQRLEDFRQLVRDARRQRQREDRGGPNDNDDSASNKSSEGSESTEASSSDSDEKEDATAEEHTTFYRQNYEGRPAYTGPITDRSTTVTADAPPQEASRDAPGSAQIGSNHVVVAKSARTTAAAAHVDPMAAAESIAAASAAPIASPAAVAAPPSARDAAFSRLWDMAAAIPTPGDGAAGGNGDADNDDDMWVPPAAAAATARSK